MQAATETRAPSSTAAQVSAWVERVHEGLAAGTLAPYLGPGVLAPDAGVPASEAALAELFGRQVALPRRARGNLWASAQYIESQKHRATLDAMMVKAFSAPAMAAPLHRYLASLPLPLIVDTWYDGSMRAALSGRTDWAEAQGGSRALVGESRFVRSYQADGRECAAAALREVTTLLYKPHGAATPAQSFLVSDADYVEVLTEIDIQTPIPPEVQRRRAGLGFVYLGCRFHDQTMRIFARQIGKRAEGPRFAVVDPAIGLTPNEQRFLASSATQVIHAPLSEVCAALAAG